MVQFYMVSIYSGYKWWGNYMQDRAINRPTNIAAWDIWVTDPPLLHCPELRNVLTSGCVNLEGLMNGIRADAMFRTYPYYRILYNVSSKTDMEHLA